MTDLPEPVLGLLACLALAIVAGAVWLLGYCLNGLQRWRRPSYGPPPPTHINCRSVLDPRTKPSRALVNGCLVCYARPGEPCAPGCPVGSV